MSRPAVDYSGRTGYTSGAMDEYRRHLAQEVQRPAVELFAAFARFDFALKRGGYLAGTEGHRADANWNGFANDLGPDFLLTLKGSPQAAIFFTKPPKTLKVVNGEASFVVPEVIVNTQQLFEAVRRVRNNLFHGDKPHMDGRDSDLIAASLFVLDAAFEAAQHNPLCNAVTYAFVFAPINDH